MANTFELVGQDMLHKAVDKPICLHAHYLLAIAVGRIAHAETDGIPRHAKDTIARDGHPLCVAPQIFQHLCGTT